MILWVLATSASVVLDIQSAITRRSASLYLTAIFAMSSPNGPNAAVTEIPGIIAIAICLIASRQAGKR
jgi:hypothetical protein